MELNFVAFWRTALVLLCLLCRHATSQSSNITSEGSSLNVPSSSSSSSSSQAAITLPPPSSPTPTSAADLQPFSLVVAPTSISQLALQRSDNTTTPQEAEHEEDDSGEASANRKKRTFSLNILTAPTSEDQYTFFLPSVAYVFNRITLASSTSTSSAFNARKDHLWTIGTSGSSTTSSILLQDSDGLKLTCIFQQDAGYRPTSGEDDLISIHLAPDLFNPPIDEEKWPNATKAVLRLRFEEAPVPLPAEPWSESAAVSPSGQIAGIVGGTAAALVSSLCGSGGASAATSLGRSAPLLASLDCATFNQSDDLHPGTHPFQLGIMAHDAAQYHIGACVMNVALILGVLGVQCGIAAILFSKEKASYLARVLAITTRQEEARNERSALKRQEEEEQARRDAEEKELEAMVLLKERDEDPLLLNPFSLPLPPGVEPLLRHQGNDVTQSSSVRSPGSDCEGPSVDGEDAVEDELRNLGRSPTFADALAKVHCPNVTYAFLLVLLEPTVRSGTIAALQGTTSAGRTIGGFVVVVLICCCSGVLVYIATVFKAIYFEHIGVFSPRVLKFFRGSGAWEDRSPNVLEAQTLLKQKEKVILEILEALEQGQLDTFEARSRMNVVKREIGSLKYTIEHGHRIRIPPAKSSFTRSHGILFAAYREKATWFMRVEMLTPIAIGIVSGSGVGCALLGWVLFGLVSAYTTVFLIIRPHHASFEIMFCSAITVLQFVSALALGLHHSSMDSSLMTNLVVLPAVGAAFLVVIKAAIDVGVLLWDICSGMKTKREKDLQQIIDETNSICEPMLTVKSHQEGVADDSDSQGAAPDEFDYEALLAKSAAHERIKRPTKPVLKRRASPGKRRTSHPIRGLYGAEYGLLNEEDTDSGDSIEELMRSVPQFEIQPTLEQLQAKKDKERRKKEKRRRQRAENWRPPTPSQPSESDDSFDSDVGDVVHCHQCGRIMKVHLASTPDDEGYHRVCHCYDYYHKRRDGKAQVPLGYGQHALSFHRQMITEHGRRSISRSKSPAAPKR